MSFFGGCLADIGIAGDNVRQGNCLSKFSNLMGFLDAFKAVFGVANCLLRRCLVIPSFRGASKARTRNPVKQGLSMRLLGWTAPDGICVPE
jgi:hypothetical protein